MKKIFFICLLLIIIGCVPFNRDALWNAPINHPDYCTYFQEDFPIGSIFVHRYDDWTEKRLNCGYELKVIGKLNDNILIVDHGWSTFYCANPIIYLSHSPILIKLLDDKRAPNIGEFFNVYGQYKYVQNYTLSNKRILKCFKQLNYKQDLVVKPFPFFYIRGVNDPN